MRKLSRKMIANSLILKSSFKSSLKYFISGAERNLVLDVGNHTIKMSEYIIVNNQIQVLKGFIVPTPNGAVKNDRIVDVENISKIILKKMKDEHINTKRLTISIASSEIITREMVVPSIKPEEMSNFIEANASDIFPVKLATYSLGYSIIEEYKDKGIDMSRIIIAAMPREIIMPYIELATLLKLELKYVNFSGFELYNFINFEIEEKELGYAVIDFGAKNTNLVIVSNGIFRFNRIINRGSEEITKIIQEELGCNSIRAEQLKRQYNSVIILGKLKQDADVYKVAKITQRVITDIMQDVLRVIEFYNTNNPRNKITRIYLTGLGSKISGIEEFLEGILGFQVVRIKEFKKVKFELEARKLRNRQLTFINCFGSAKLDEKEFNFIKGDLQLSTFMLLNNETFYKSVICGVLIGLLIASGINFNTYLIKEKTREYNGIISLKMGITELQEKIENERITVGEYENLLNEIGYGAETFNEELEIIDNIIAEMSSKVDIVIERYYFTADSIRINCKATQKNSANTLEDEAYMNYLNAPYDFEDKLSEYFEYKRGNNTKPDDFVLTLTIK